MKQRQSNGVLGTLRSVPNAAPRGVDATMADSAIYVVQICCDKGGVRALVRAATSASTEEFTSGEALWRFFAAQNPRPETDQATPE